MLAFIGGMGMWESLLIILVVILLFGAKRIPSLARSLGQSLAEFRKGRQESTSTLLNAEKEKKEKEENQH